MFNSHNKRSWNGGHLAHAARAVNLPSSDLLQSSQTTPSPSLDPKNTDTTTTPPQPSSSNNNNTPGSSSASTPSSSSVSSSSSSLGSSSSGLSSSHTSTSTTSSAISSSSLPPNPLSTSPLSLTATRVSTGNLFSTPTQSPTGSSTPGTSGGTSTGLIIGAVAGTLAGIAVLGFLVMWCMRRQRERDTDDFDAQAFKRQSAILVDDPIQPPRSYNPRPPTMIEHHNASPALATQAVYGGQNFYGNYGGYGSQPPNAPMEMIPPTSSPPQAYGAPPMGYAGYGDPQQQIARQPSDAGYAGYNSVARQPSNAQYLTRQPSSPAFAAAPPGPLDGNTSYIDLNRSSVSPYQAAQYADISRQLGAANPNEQVHNPYELPDDPLPSPFDDPVEATPAQNTTPQGHVHHPFDAPAPGPVNITSTPQSQGNTTESHQRPATVYEENDAYGGI